jgi:hypothetical protein
LVIRQREGLCVGCLLEVGCGFRPKSPTIPE